MNKMRRLLPIVAIGLLEMLTCGGCATNSSGSNEKYVRTSEGEKVRETDVTGYLFNRGCYTPDVAEKP